MTIKNLENVPLEQLHTAFLDAFSNYHIPFQISREALAYMLKRRGYSPQLSFGAFEGEKVLSFIFNGVRQWNGKKTAYDTGTGTIPSHQGKGIAKQLFARTIAQLKEQQIEQYLLEVLKNNTHAVRLYEKSGFQVSRHFNFFNFKTADIKELPRQQLDNIEIKQLSDWDWPLLQSFWDFTPSWQNSIDSLETVSAELLTFGAFQEGQLIAYLILEPASGDIPQLAIAKTHRQQGVANALLQIAAEHRPAETMKIINTQLEDNGFAQFMDRLGIQPGVGQFEMILEVE